MPGWNGLIATAPIECLLSGWIPDSTRCEAMRGFRDCCAGSGFLEARRSETERSPSLTGVMIEFSSFLAITPGAGLQSEHL